MERFHAGKILMPFGRQLVEGGLCDLDLDPNAPMDDDGEDATRDCAIIDICIVEPEELPECAELNLYKVVREAGRLALAAVNRGRRKKAVLAIGDGPVPVPAGTRIVHLHDRSHMWRFSIELYVQGKDSARRAYANRRALNTWKPTTKTRRPEVARLLAAEAS